MIAELFAAGSITPAGAIPEMLEAFCWCAALATWLMILGAFVREAIRPLAKTYRRLRPEISRCEHEGARPSTLDPL